MARRTSKTKEKQARPPHRPPHVPTEATRHLVMVMRVNGETEETIAKCIGDKGIALNTLTKHYANELELGKARLLAAVAGGAFRRALNGDNDMTKLILRTRAGWAEKQVIEQTGKDGGPLKFEEVSAPHLIIEQRLAALAKAHGPKPDGEA